MQELCNVNYICYICVYKFRLIKHSGLIVWDVLISASKYTGFANYLKGKTVDTIISVSFFENFWKILGL